MKTISSRKWTEISIDHIAMHAVSADEVEEVCFNEDEPPLIRSEGGNLHYIFGNLIPAECCLSLPGLFAGRDCHNYSKRHE